MSGNIYIYIMYIYIITTWIIHHYHNYKIVAYNSLVEYIYIYTVYALSGFHYYIPIFYLADTYIIMAIIMWPIHHYSNYSGIEYIKLHITVISYPYLVTSSTAQGGGGSFKNRKPIGEVGCCESGMAGRSHWLTEKWLELCLLEWLQWLQWSPHPQLLDVVWCKATVVVVVA